VIKIVRSKEQVREALNSGSSAQRNVTAMYCCAILAATGHMSLDEVVAVSNLAYRDGVPTQRVMSLYDLTLEAIEQHNRELAGAK